MEKKGIIKLWSQELWRAILAPREPVSIQRIFPTPRYGFTVFVQSYFKIAMDQWPLSAVFSSSSLEVGEPIAVILASFHWRVLSLGKEKITVFCFGLVLVHRSLDQEEPSHILLIFGVETIMRTQAFDLLSWVFWPSPLRSGCILCGERRKANICKQDAHCGILLHCSQLFLPPFQPYYISLPLAVGLAELPYGTNIVPYPIFHLVM